VLPYRRKVMDAEDSVEDKDKKVDRTLRKMLQDPFRDIVRARCLAEFKTPNGFMNLFGVVQLWLAGRGLKVRLQRHVDHLNNGRDRVSGNRLELSLQTVGKCLRLLRVGESDSPRCLKDET
jgi:hypothetical protein